MIRLNNLVTQINNLQLTVKIMLIFVISSTVLLTTELASRNMPYEAYDEQIYLRTTQVLISYVNQIETEFKKIDNTTLSIIGNDSIQKKLNMLREGNASDIYSIQNDITTQLSSYLKLEENCDLLAIGFSDGKMLGKQLLKKERMQEFAQMAIEKEGKMVLVPEGEHVWIIRQIRQIESMNWEDLGTIVARMDLNRLTDEINNNYKKINVLPDLSICNDEEVIYSTGEEIVWMESGENWQMIGDKFVARSYSNRLNWTFYISVPYGKIQGAITNANACSVLITVAVAIICNVACYIMMKHIIKHINVLLEKFDDFGNGVLPDKNLDARYKERRDEIGRLHNQFSKMAADHKRITDENYNSMLLLKEAQFCQLQQQIQPHFMFNTLSTIAWTAYENGDEKAARMAEALCEILRGSVNNTLKSTTVREEMNIVNAYIFIQKIRYEGRFEVEVDMPEEIMETEIPPFTLQPLVENTIVHVVERSLEPCEIKISGRITDNVVEIRIVDSGSSLETDILDKLEAGEMKSRGNGVGLLNINRRIKHLYSEEYGLSTSKIENNSCVTIQVPYGQR